MSDYKKLAELLFPDCSKTPEEYEAFYPPRALGEGARVTRFAPSPTGFLHIGGLFASLAAERAAHLSGGVFFLRIEDTDKKREVEDGVTGIIKGLESFHISFDEGMTGPVADRGAYAPYLQSRRAAIYASCARRLVELGLAYPCFCGEAELQAIRAEQEAKKELPGYYGAYAKCRDLPFEAVEARVKAGESYVIRLRSPGRADRRVSFKDGVKGKIEMPENTMDIVLLKSDGIPTYHFAHAVDDHFMRTTDVIRGDEWVSSVPVHLQLFEVLGYKPPRYAHISPIMKEDGGAKRKISKRKDPEAAVSYFVDEGYPAESVLEYLLTLLNSNYEDWRRANPALPYTDFPFSLSKMSSSGALFDMAKLMDLSRNVIARMTAQEVYDGVTAWAQIYDAELFTLLSRDRAYAEGIFAIDRGGAKPRRDIAKWSDVRQWLSFFYDELWNGEYDELGNMTREDTRKIIEAYCAVYDVSDDKDTWFNKIKDLCEPLGFAREVKTYKKNPDAYKGHVGDVSGVLRLALTGRRQTPDLCSIMALFGRERCQARFARFLAAL